jgi:tetratricopeptide (TPR) repeat protein
MKYLIHTAALMGFAALMLSAQQLPPPAGAAPAAAQGGPSKEEIDALQKIQGATDPDVRMKAVDDFALKFPDSKFRGGAFTAGGQAAQAKRDSAKAKFYYENAIKADPNSDYALIMLGAEIANSVGEHDLDKKQKLDQAQSYAEKAMDLVAKRPKQAGETDAQFEEGKKDDIALAHLTLGLVKNSDQKYAEAGKEFVIAYDSATPGHGDATNLLRAGMAFNNGKQFDDAHKALDRFLALPGIPDEYKKMAQQLRNQK